MYVNVCVRVCVVMYACVTFCVNVSLPVGITMCPAMYVDVVCAFWLPVCVKICSQIAKIVKNHINGMKHLQWNGASPVFLLVNFDLHFQDQTLHFS